MARPGKAWPGKAWLGEAGSAWRGTAWQGKARQARLGMAGQGLAGRGEAGRGKAGISWIEKMKIHLHVPQTRQGWAMKDWISESEFKTMNELIDDFIRQLNESNPQPDNANVLFQSAERIRYHWKMFHQAMTQRS